MLKARSRRLHIIELIRLFPLKINNIDFLLSVFNFLGNIFTSFCQSQEIQHIRICLFQFVVDGSDLDFIRLGCLVLVVYFVKDILNGIVDEPGHFGHFYILVLRVTDLL